MDKIQAWLNQKGDSAATALCAVLAPLGVRAEALQAAIESDLAEVRLDALVDMLERAEIDPATLVARAEARVAQKAAAEAAQQEVK